MRSSAISRRRGHARCGRSQSAAAQAIWSFREAALGLSTAMKSDAKAISFVEDTAVAPEKLRDYIERFVASCGGTRRRRASMRMRRSAACTSGRW
jgi:hypothetical protein